MITLSLDYSDLEQTDPKATLRIFGDGIEQVHLSVASRAARNRKALYSKKHGDSKLASRDRPEELTAVNTPILEHYKSLPKSFENSRVIALPISDLTANPLRPHYDASISPEQLGGYSDGSDTRLFYLEDEPIGEVPYTLLFSYEERGQTRLAIHHEVKVEPNGSLPDKIPQATLEGLNWWAACPPLLMGGQHYLDRYTLLDYDLRHVFGFPESFSKGSEARSEKEKELLDMYQQSSFPNWGKWCDLVRQKLRGLQSYETGYHAALGISGRELIVVHRITTIPNLAEELRSLGAQDAVLLDSGGSCAIWANWANGGDAGVLASAWNFRPPRGAVIFLVLKGKRFPQGVR